jgi:hypothetical protein
MNLINKEFLEIGSGNVIRIIDVYQNIAVTSEKERIDVRRLTDKKYYIPNDGGLFEIKSTVSSENITSQPSEKKFEIKMDDHIDPNRFLNNERTYSMFAEAIKSIPEDKIPSGEMEIQMPVSKSQMPPISTSESAIIVDHNYDEKEELMRKYGMTQDQNLEVHNKKFEKFLTDDPISESMNTEIIETQRVVIPQRQDDPIVTMFKNVKKSVDFKIGFEIENKIPRLDFIEMMEDSYETSIIDFFAEEFTNSLLKNPNLIKKKISDEIKKMVYGEDKKDDRKRAPEKSDRRAPKKTATKRTARPKKPTSTSSDISKKEEDKKEQIK